MKTLSERFSRYARSRFQGIAGVGRATEVMRAAEAAGIRVFDALRDHRDSEGLGVFGAPAQSNAVIACLEFDFAIGKVPMYDNKPVKDRSTGSNDVVSKYDALCAEISEIKKALTTSRLGGSPDADALILESEMLNLPAYIKQHLDGKFFREEGSDVLGHDKYGRELTITQERDGTYTVRALPTSGMPGVIKDSGLGTEWDAMMEVNLHADYSSKVCAIRDIFEEYEAAEKRKRQVESAYQGRRARRIKTARDS